METTSSIKAITHESYLDLMLQYAFQEGFNFAVWRKPKSNQVEIIIDSEPVLRQGMPQLEELPAGFIAHNFEDGTSPSYFFLEAKEYYSLDLGTPVELEENHPFVENTTLSKTELQKLVREGIKKASKGLQVQETSKEDFIDQVQKGIDQINGGKLIKVVPAKIKKQELNENLDLSQTFLKLCESYPNAFINFVHSPAFGTWMGASPEVLIKTEGNTFSTMSLAGTQKAIGDNPLKTAAWTQKEIEEQALVSRYIVNSFKKIRLREYEEKGPKTVLAGNLLHLRSDFIVDMEATNFPQLGSTMLELLHPTSAVCGMPRQAALDFISANERFERTLFAGYFGPVNVQDATSVFVNLRTAQLMGDHAYLYAGAGITEDSIAEKEWEETEMKCDIIGRFFTKENK
ncbi:chorismate-binding protein [Litoribacter ruber]|uniref:chorismate-binding protein n=1 Tax=Litoribacter ruber TaxID=702568 RepID=UPI001BD9BFDA|nr:chorismate-binding protein [Litoribacter ruber]MBT0812740.1 chorismate-binding protein [Litoribacter ruber]